MMAVLRVYKQTQSYAHMFYVEAIVSGHNRKRVLHKKCKCYTAFLVSVSSRTPLVTVHRSAGGAGGGEFVKIESMETDTNLMGSFHRKRECYSLQG